MSGTVRHDVILSPSLTFPQQAIGLIFSGRADMVANNRRFIHTASCSYPLSLGHFAQSNGSPSRLHLKLTRREMAAVIIIPANIVANPYNSRQLAKSSRHLQVVSTPWTNMVAACPACNHHKGGRLLQDAGMRLLHQPTEPPSSAFYILGEISQKTGSGNIPGRLVTC